jgi:hypothetical protein
MRGAGKDDDQQRVVVLARRLFLCCVHKIELTASRILER